MTPSTSRTAPPPAAKWAAIVAAVSFSALDGGLVDRDCVENASRTSSAIAAESPTTASLVDAPLARVTLPLHASVLERLTPAVGESHFGHRAARRATELAQRIAQRDQRGGLDVGWNAEQLLHLRVAELVDGSETAADAERARRQHDVLHGRIDRRAGRDRRLDAGVERDARQDQHRRLAHVLAEMARRGEHLSGRAVGRSL